MKRNHIHVGDALKVMRKWPDESVELAFADPPYNIGYVYDAYNDDLPDDEFVQWCTAWMAECQRVLKPTGSFYVAIGDDFAAELRIAGKRLGLLPRNWIIWQYNFGQHMRRKFGRDHTHILYFTKSEEFTFNDHLLRYPSARHTEYQDLRANPDGRLPGDVWDEFPRVCGTFKERDGLHGCQLPESLLMRIILASSNPGEVVLDPFVGSGTTAAVAKQLGRDYLGIDISKSYAKLTRERLARIKCELGAEPRDADAGVWPELHVSMLQTLYRETNVAYDHLVANDVALGVIARSLSARAGWSYTPEQVITKLGQLRKFNGGLPKIPNDRPFAKRKHVKDSGKRYERKVFRWKGRKGDVRPSDTDTLRLTGT